MEHKNRGKKCNCPNCGCEKYKEKAGTNNLVCDNCHMEYNRHAWEKDNDAPLQRAATRTVGEDCASNKPAPEHDPNIKRKTRDSNDEPGNDPVMRLKDNKKNKEDVGRRAMSNPFVKKSVKFDPPKRIDPSSAWGEGLSGEINRLKDMTDQIGFDKSIYKILGVAKKYNKSAEDIIELIKSTNSFYPDAKPGDAFYEEEQKIKSENEKFDFPRNANSKSMSKKSRDFRRSEWAEFMKNLSEDNMTYNEEPIPNQEGSAAHKSNGGENNGGNGHKTTILQNFDYNQVDRKEYRSSPKGRDVIPGQAEWEDAQVDKYYDGWIVDHIENSGGKMIGSNTEKTMNLNDGERRKAPVYPTEAVYEHLLESRHMFNDDYAWVTASNGKKISLSKSALKNTKLSEIFSYKELRREAYKWLEKNTEYIGSFLNDKSLPSEVKSVIQRIAIRALEKKAEGMRDFQSAYEMLDVEEQENWEASFLEHIEDIIYALQDHVDLQKICIRKGGPRSLISDENTDDWFMFFQDLGIENFFNLGILGIHKGFDDMFESHVVEDAKDPEGHRFEMDDVSVFGEEKQNNEKINFASKTIFSKSAKKALIQAKIASGIKEMEKSWREFEQNGFVSESVLKNIFAQTTDSDSFIDENDPSESPNVKKKSLSKNIKGSKTAQKQKLRTIPV